jgi:pyrophosphatase PpaX
MMARPGAVLFDLDGTLVDTIELLLSSMRHAFRSRPERAPTFEQWIAGIGTPLATQLRVYAANETELEELTEGYRSYQILHHDRLTRCYEGAVSVVEDLHRRGHPMAVVTSKGNGIARRTIEYVGLDRYLPVIVGVDSTRKHKPDPEPVYFALEQLGAPRETAAFVGDSPHDVAAGNAAGVTTIGALWGPFSREALVIASPTYLLEGIRELPGLLDSLSATKKP